MSRTACLNYSLLLLVHLLRSYSLYLLLRPLRAIFILFRRRSVRLLLLLVVSSSKRSNKYRNNPRAIYSILPVLRRGEIWLKLVRSKPISSPDKWSQWNVSRERSPLRREEILMPVLDDFFARLEMELREILDSGNWKVIRVIFEWWGKWKERRTGRERGLETATNGNKTDGNETGLGSTAKRGWG